MIDENVLMIDEWMLCFKKYSYNFNDNKLCNECSIDDIDW